MSSLKFESLKDDFESISSRLDHQPISAQALTRLNSILSNLEDEARGAPERYRAGMIEDVEDYRKQLRGYQAEAAGMGIRYVRGRGYVTIKDRVLISKPLETIKCCRI